MQFFDFIFDFAEAHDETRIEELHKKRNYLAAYCKLVVYNVIPVKAAADIFKHYLRVRFFQNRSFPFFCLFFLCHFRNVPFVFHFSVLQRIR